MFVNTQLIEHLEVFSLITPRKNFAQFLDHSTWVIIILVLDKVRLEGQVVVKPGWKGWGSEPELSGKGNCPGQGWEGRDGLRMAGCSKRKCWRGKGGGGCRPRRAWKF